MALADLLPLAIPIGLAFLAGGEDEASGPPTPSAPPGPGGFTPGQVEALLEIHEVDGHPVQYFKAQVVTAMYGMLQASYLVPLPPVVQAQNPLLQAVPAGSAALFQVVHASQMGGAPPAGLATAAVAVLGAAKAGLSVLGTLTLPFPSGGGDRWVAICKPNVVSTLARKGTKWAVALDPARDFYPSPPAGPPAIPGGQPGGPPPPPPPPPVPGGGGYPADDVPFGLPPGLPGGDGLDAHMPAELRQEVLDMLADPDLDPVALETAADGLEEDYPMAAAALRARAAQLRAQAKLEAIKNGGTPFTIRYGDIPYKLAAYYTGDPSRWKELPSNNADRGMKIVTVNGTTQLDPWHGTIKLPVSWEAWAKPLPPVASGGAPAPNKPAPSGDDDDWPGPPYAEGATSDDVPEQEPILRIKEPLVVSKYGPAPKVSGAPPKRRRKAKAKA